MERHIEQFFPSLYYYNFNKIFHEEVRYVILLYRSMKKKVIEEENSKIYIPVYSPLLLDAIPSVFNKHPYSCLVLGSSL